MSNKTYRFLNPYSSVKGKKPSADTMYFGEIYVNGNADEPHLYIKNSSGEVVSFDTPIEVSSAVTSGDTNAVAGGAVFNTIAETELVIANALNALNDEKQDVLTAGNGIDITNDIISVTGGSGGGVTSGEVQTMIDQSISGKVNTSDFNVYSGAVDTALSNKVSTSAVTSAVTANSTDVLTSGGAYAQFGGLKLVKLTQAEYDALSPNYDANTIYYIVN